MPCAEARHTKDLKFRSKHPKNRTEQHESSYLTGLRQLSFRCSRQQSPSDFGYLYTKVL